MVPDKVALSIYTASGGPFLYSKIWVSNIFEPNKEQPTLYSNDPKSIKLINIPSFGGFQYLTPAAFVTWRA